MALHGRLCNGTGCDGIVIEDGRRPTELEVQTAAVTISGAHRLIPSRHRPTMLPWLRVVAISGETCDFPAFRRRRNQHRVLAVTASGNDSGHGVLGPSGKGVPASGWEQLSCGHFHWETRLLWPEGKRTYTRSSILSATQRFLGFMDGPYRLTGDIRPNVVDAVSQLLDELRPEFCLFPRWAGTGDHKITSDASMDARRKWDTGDRVL